MRGYSLDVHIFMERGMYERLVERAEELGMPLSAVVREAVAQYFENIPTVPERETSAVHPEDPIWDLPTLSDAYGRLNTPADAGDMTGEATG